MHFSSTLAIHATQGVLDELNKRNGFGDWWKSIEASEQGNIIFTLEGVIDRTIEKHTPQES